MIVSNDILVLLGILGILLGRSPIDFQMALSLFEVLSFAFYLEWEHCLLSLHGMTATLLD